MQSELGVCVLAKVAPTCAQRERTQTRMVLSTLPVAMSASLYLFQSQHSTSYACAATVALLNGCRASHTFRLQSPLAVANTSAALGFLLCVGEGGAE